MEYSAPNNVMVIGLGGTGKWILTYLKQSLIHATNHAVAQSSSKKNLEAGFSESIPKNIRLLCMDTDDKPVFVDGVSLDYDEVSGNEFICLKNQNNELGRLKDELIAKANREYDPAIVHQNFPWLEAEDVRMLTILPEGHGAGAQRHFSRLCFLKNELSTGAFQRNINDALAQFGRGKSYFIVVGSIAGGTGSGTFQDVMLFLKNIIRKRSDMLPVICGIAVLSNAFRVPIEDHSVDEGLMKSNCIAALREFQRFVVLHGEKYPSQEFPGFKDFSHINDLPCDVMYLLDGTRPQLGTDLTKTAVKLSLYPAVADYLHALCCHEAISFDPTNTKNYLKDSEQNLFSTFGEHTWICPVEDVISSFSIRLAQQYVAHILEAVPPNYKPLEEVKDLLTNSEKYYCLNTPKDEYFRGVSENSNDRFSFLNQFYNIIETYDQNPTSLPVDVDYFKGDFFNGMQFPKRYIRPNMSQDMLAGCDLPFLEPESGVDVFKGLELIKGISEPQQAITLCKKTFRENIGDINDVYDPLDPKRRVTYHATLQYYERLALENFGGYKDADGNYRPGILENKIFLILNEKITPTRRKDNNGNDASGEEASLPLFDVTYRIGKQPIERTIAFCLTLQQQFQKTKEIIDKAYEVNNKINNEHLNEICKREAHDREESYLNANAITKAFKRGPYLESMQRWLASERTVTMKRSIDKIADGFIAITKGWQEALEKCQENYRKFTSDLTLLKNDTSIMRMQHQNIITRTYLMKEDSPEENALYTNLFETQSTNSMQNQQQVRSTKLSQFIASSKLDIFQNFSDVNTRAGIKRTGRDVRALFTQNDTPIEVFTPNDILRNAAFWCQDVRDVNFWDSLLADPAYSMSSSVGYPTQLASELRNDTDAFIKYDNNDFSPNPDELNNKLIEDALYADFDAGAGKFKLFELTNTINLNDNQRRPANRDCGQQHRMTAIRQINGLSIASLSNYGTQYGVYRNRIKTTRSSSAGVGTPIHIHLGEKYATMYEQMIFDQWRRLGLTSVPPEDFTLPLEVTFALQNRQLLKEFVWAGLYLNLIIQEAAPGGGSTYSLSTPQGLLVQLGRGQNMEVPLLSDILPEYVSNDGSNSNLSHARKDVKEALSQLALDKNSDRAAFNMKMENILKAPLDNMIKQSGHATTTFIELLGRKRTLHVNTMTPLEKFELLCKCFIIEELS